MPRAIRTYIPGRAGQGKGLGALGPSRAGGSRSRGPNTARIPLHQCPVLAGTAILAFTLLTDLQDVV